ncbi:MAG: hypothetical protein Q8O17_00745 [Candidatus Methanoperedens sp.]|jgi:hypothetical protein|nr:hypothetical protein [Candidatus Methanoperedens sp.]
MPMDEDAMFKALLKNKPQPKQTVSKNINEVPAQPARPPATAARGSEDAMFKALLHNRPPAPVPKQQAKVEPVHMAPQAARVQQEPVVITQVSPPPVVKLEPVVDSINNLTASVNQIHGLMKTIVVPVMILILLVGIGILIKI